MTNPHFCSAWRFILGWQINKERKTSVARLPLNAKKTNDWEGRGGAAHRFPEPHSSSSSSDWRSAGSSAGAAEAFWAVHNSTWSDDPDRSTDIGRGGALKRNAPVLPSPPRLSSLPLSTPPRPQNPFHLPLLPFFSRLGFNVAVSRVSSSPASHRRLPHHLLRLSTSSSSSSSSSRRVTPPAPSLSLLALQATRWCQSVSAPLSAHSHVIRRQDGHTHLPGGALDLGRPCCDTDLLTKVWGRLSVFHHPAHSPERGDTSVQAAASGTGLSLNIKTQQL